VTPKRKIALILLSSAGALAVTASLLIHFIWHNESWADPATAVLFAFCVVSVVVLRRLWAPLRALESSLYRVLSPHTDKRKVVIGILIMLCTFPWTIAIGLAIRYSVLPNNVASGLLLLIPLAGFIIIGLWLVIRATLGSR
jgi:hypothetical protein